MKTHILILSFIVSLIFTGRQAVAALVPDPKDGLEAPGGNDLIADWMTVHIKAIRNSKIPSQQHERNGI